MAGNPPGGAASSLLRRSFTDCRQGSDLGSAWHTSHDRLAGNRTASGYLKHTTARCKHKKAPECYRNAGEAPPLHLVHLDRLTSGATEQDDRTDPSAACRAAHKDTRQKTLLKLTFLGKSGNWEAEQAGHKRKLDSVLKFKWSYTNGSRSTGRQRLLTYNQ